LTYKKGKITTTHFGVTSPPLDTTIDGEALLDVSGPHPSVTANVKLPAGRLGPWPFHDGVVEGRYMDQRWEFLTNSLQYLDGRVSAKGYLGSGASDLTITADNLSL